MKNWKEAVLKPGENIRSVLRKIDRAATRIGFLCDDSNKLLAIVSDGDIRRGLLLDADLNDPIDTVANYSPITCYCDANKLDMLAILRENQIDVLPLVDDHGVLTDAVTIEIIQRPVKRDNPVFIMAGGFGTRLRPLTDHTPKPMLPLGDKPLLEHIIRRFINQGFWNFYLSTHYLPDVIVNHFGDGSDLGCSINYITEEVPLGTGGALGLLPENVSALPLILMNGDVLTDVSFEALLSTHNRVNADATMCLREHETSVAYGVVTVEDNAVVDMLEKPTYRHLINTGIYVLSNDLIKASRIGEKIDLPTLLERRIARGKKVAAHKFYGQWIDIGHVSDYKRAVREILNNDG